MSPFQSWPIFSLIELRDDLADHDTPECLMECFPNAKTQPG